MVRKYSSKRLLRLLPLPLKILQGVLIFRLNGKLAGKSHVGFGISALRNVLDEDQKTRQASDAMDIERLTHDGATSSKFKLTDEYSTTEEESESSRKEGIPIDSLLHNL
ncbi:hypothetical protein HAX54_024467 [Datura stramonium]|uniref:Uncharacterized protein n=1 Tax=Datura stramonium TaxID=4076 RepID=A0ABS8UY35_DATST|nr:hypothetical protein [Datura stramonium]